MVAEERRIVDAEYAVDFTGQVDRPVQTDQQVAEDFRKRQRDHGKIVAAQSKADRADHESEHCRDGTAERQSQNER